MPSVATPANYIEWYATTPLSRIRFLVLSSPGHRVNRPVAVRTAKETAASTKVRALGRHKLNSTVHRIQSFLNFEVFFVQKTLNNNSPDRALHSRRRHAQNSALLSQQLTIA